MKVAQYAESKSFDLNLIPTIDSDNRVLYTEKLNTSRTIKNLNYKVSSEDYEGTRNQELDASAGYWSDYRYDKLKYLLEYDDYKFTENINRFTNIFDRILNLNPKQVGIVNTEIPKVFCEGNEIHYSILKNGFVPLINSERTGKNRYVDPDYNRSVTLNNNILGWGEIQINNPLFVSIVDSFYEKNKEYTYANRTSFSYDLQRRLPESDLSRLLYVNYKTKTLGEFGPFYIYDSGANTGKSFSFIDDIIYTDYSIRLVKNVDFSSEGTLKGSVNKSTGLKKIEETLKSMYFWNSAVITTISDDREVRYYIVVGLKPFRYLLNKEIETMFFIDIGNNLDNTSFDQTDIIFYRSDLKTFLKKTNANVVYFTNFSYHPLGNICPNGLAFGANSKLLSDIVNSINMGNDNYSSVEYQINNIYNIFTILQG